MAATHRLKGIGWFAVLAGVILGFYLISLQVAAERKKLDDATLRVAGAQNDIRALETEFDTRANLTQLERWNGDTLALAAPTAAQFVTDEAALAALDPNAAPGAQVRTAALVVPALGPVVAPTPQAPTPQVSVALASAAPVRIAPVAATTIAVPTGRAAPAIARAVEAERGVAAVARVRPQAVAMLDRQLLSDTTFGDIMSGARRESRR